MKARRALQVFVLAVLILIATPLLAPAAQPIHRPKLILAIVIDQFRYDYLLRFRSDYHDGLDRC